MIEEKKKKKWECRVIPLENSLLDVSLPPFLFLALFIDINAMSVHIYIYMYILRVANDSRGKIPFAPG